MLKLILNEQGLPEHRWVVDPAEFPGITIIGEAVKDEAGKYIDSQWLTKEGESYKFDKTKLEAAIKKNLEAERLAAEAEKAKQDKIKLAKELRAKPAKTPKDIEDLVNLLADHVL